MPLNLQLMSQPFEKWAIDFLGLIKPSRKNGCKIYYHCDKVFDLLGRSVAGKRLYDYHDREVFV